jgi:hypothetical protein
LVAVELYLLAAYCLQDSLLTEVLMPIALTSISLMIFMLALFYMAANFFKKSEYESYVSIEVYQLLVSLLLFLFVFTTACFSSMLGDGYAGGDQFDVARAYLYRVSNQIALPALVDLEKAKMVAQYWGSLSFRWGLAVWGASVPGFPSFIVLERVIDFLLMLMTPFVASLMVQQILLEVIRAIAIPFVLPAGVVLRIFPPTRDAGSFLISAAIGFGIVFPYTYVMHKNIVQDRLLVMEDGEKSMDEILSSPGATGNAHTKLLASLNYGHFWSANDMVIKPMRLLSYVILQAVFLPALSMTLTIAFIKGTVKFMGQKLE